MGLIGTIFSESGLKEARRDEAAEWREFGGSALLPARVRTYGPLAVTVAAIVLFLVFGGSEEWWALFIFALVASLAWVAYRNNARRAFLREKLG